MLFGSPGQRLLGSQRAPSGAMGFHVASRLRPITLNSPDFVLLIGHMGALVPLQFHEFSKKGPQIGFPLLPWSLLARGSYLQHRAQSKEAEDPSPIFPELELTPRDAKLKVTLTGAVWGPRQATQAARPPGWVHVWRHPQWPC